MNIRITLKDPKKCFGCPYHMMRFPNKCGGGFPNTLNEDVILIRPKECIEKFGR